VSSIANDLGIPSWFVDLRHQGTHDQLPSLPLLRVGAKQALDWLYTNYWLVPKQETETLALILVRLDSYKNDMKAELKQQEQDSHQKQTRYVFY
jgi:hypothetical protein